MGILIVVGAIVMIAASIDTLFMQSYGLGADASAVVFFIGLAVFVVGVAFVLIWKGNFDDTVKSTDDAYDAVEPSETEIDSDGNEIDTAWTALTKERTDYHDERLH